MKSTIKTGKELSPLGGINLLILTILAGLALFSALSLLGKLLILTAYIFLSLASVFDLTTLRVPNKLNLAFGVTMFLLTILFSQLAKQWEHLGTSDTNLGRVALVGVTTTVAFFLVHLLNPRGLGMGDVKFSFGLATFLGWYSIRTLLAGLFLGCLLNGISALLVICACKKSPKPVLPFVHSLSVGAFLALTLT